MRKLILGVLLGLLPNLGWASCDPNPTYTYTPRFGITLPPQNACSWGTTLNNNFTLIDSSMCVQSGSNTFTGANTFANITVSTGGVLTFKDATNTKTMTVGATSSNTNKLNISASDGLYLSQNIYTANGSASSPTYSFTSDPLSGIYNLNDSSHTLVFVSSGNIVGTMIGNHFDTTSSGHTSYTRPLMTIGPGVLQATMTQTGEGLNVWGQTDGGGSEPQIDIVAMNIGTGDSRLLAEASMASTPQTVIGYLSAFGMGHINDPFYTNGPLRDGTVAVEFQAPHNNVFHMTTSSQTYFYNENATHGAYHFLHGSPLTSHTDDITFLDNAISVSSITVSTISLGNIIYAATGSASSPSYSFSRSTNTGMYALADSSRTLVFVSSGNIAMTIIGDHGDTASSGHTSYTRPFVSIGPGVLQATMTQTGEGLNVWGQTDGGGSEPQIDIVAMNIGTGDARVLAQASMATTPLTVIGYMQAFGAGHINDPYWTNGPQRASTVDFTFQAPSGNMFQMTTSSQTWFWNANNTHNLYHFNMGTAGTEFATIADTGTIFPGITDGSLALAGKVGQALIGYNTGVSATTGQFVNIASTTLTAGDWDVTGAAEHYTAGGTLTSVDWDLAISTFTGNTTTDHIEGYNWAIGIAPTGTNSQWMTIPRVIYNVTSSKAIYLKGRSSFTGGPPTFYGTITARRVR